MSKHMVGVLLAGGMGTRLSPITKVVNKHVLPVGELPMIAYPLRTFRVSGIKKIIVVLGEPFAEQVKLVINSLGYENLTYVVQKRPEGLPSAIGEARSIAQSQQLMVLTGDSIHAGNYKHEIKNFTDGATAFLRQVDDPRRYAVPKYDLTGNIIDIIEKPNRTRGKLAVCGPLFFDKSIFQKIKLLKKSVRNETEIVDVYKLYLKEGKFRLLKKDDYTADMGTFSSIAQVSGDLFSNRIKFEK